MSNPDAVALGNLSAFAFRHGQFGFAHLCAEALSGEAWAIQRILPALALLPLSKDMHHALVLRNVIRLTDTTRPEPDAAIARAACQP